MLWQRGPGETNPATMGGDTKSFLASLNRRLSRSLANSSWIAGVRRLSTGDPSSPLGTNARRAAATTLSGLLVLSALFIGCGGQQASFESKAASDPGANLPTPQAQANNDSKPASPESQSTMPVNINMSLLKGRAPDVEPTKVEPATSEPMKSEPTATPEPLKLDPLPEWVQSSKATTLWSRPEGQEEALADLTVNTNLMVLGKAESGRLPVRFEINDTQKPQLSGWVAITDLQAPNTSTEPSRVVASSRGMRPTPDISNNDKFIMAVAESAQVSQLDADVPTSVTIAQAILESDWGRSGLAKKGQNYFGIKAHSSPGPAGVINMSTWEVIGGSNVTVRDGFKAYHNLWESVMDHGRFLADNSRYAKAFKFSSNPTEFARQIHLAGYATDPAYTTKLVNLMKKYDLSQYDIK